MFLRLYVVVSGLRPDREEITVELKDNEIIVEGEHREQNQGESVHRQFCRRVFIPKGIQKESIKCELLAGRLCIIGMKTTGVGKRSIPIVVKKAVEQE
uniref:SHSP domain-containing protein n=1 Tax=Globodera pallida TaxID=36090 RepID=A0A183BV50_GLOPA